MPFAYLGFWDWCLLGCTLSTHTGTWSRKHAEKQRCWVQPCTISQITFASQTRAVFLCLSRSITAIMWKTFTFYTQGDAVGFFFKKKGRRCPLGSSALKLAMPKTISPHSPEQSLNKSWHTCCSSWASGVFYKHEIFSLCGNPGI